VNSENTIWQDITPPMIDIDHFHDWLELEKFFDEIGEPGISQVVKVLSQPNKSKTVTFTLYRGEDGQLLGVFGLYPDDDMQKVFINMVHPDHVRTGIATRIADFVTTQFKELTGREFDHSQSWGSVAMSPAGAAFGNSYAKKQYNNINSEES